MRTAALVALCLVVIPAGVFVWATSAPTPPSHEQVVMMVRKTGGGGLVPSAVSATLSNVLRGYVLGRKGENDVLWLCRKEGVTPDGSFAYTCSTGFAKLSVAIIPNSLCARVQEAGSARRTICIPQIVPPAEQANT